MNQMAVDIALTDVTKEFVTGFLKRKRAVENLTLDIPQGEIVGLLGANGSGKSTTIKMILGFLMPTKGQILVCGQPAGERQSRSHIGYLPENPRFQRFMTGRQILYYYGALYGLSSRQLPKRIDHMLDLVGMRDAAEERVSGYSKGMTQRLAIAQAILNVPKLLIFDEPMSGLDPLGRMEIRNVIRNIHEQMPKTTIFFSTHILSDVETLCSSVALLKKGRLQTACRIDSLMNSDAEHYSVVVTGIPKTLSEKYAKDCEMTQTSLGTNIQITGLDILISRLSEIRKSGARIVSINSQRKGLEESLFSDRAAKTVFNNQVAQG